MLRSSVHTILLVMIVMIALLPTLGDVSAQGAYSFVFDGRTLTGNRVVSYSGGQPFYFIVADETVCMEITLELDLFWDTSPHVLEFYFKDWRTPHRVDGIRHTITVPPKPDTATFTFQLVDRPVYSESSGQLINGYHLEYVITADWPRYGGLTFYRGHHALCGGTSSTSDPAVVPPQHWDPGDGRTDPRPGDRLAVYCEPTRIRVWGIDTNGQGFALTEFNILDVLLAGPTGITHDAGVNGSVSVSVDSLDNFWLAWNGGQYGATGQGDFAKGFNCAVDRLQLIAPECSEPPIDGCITGVPPSEASVIFVNGIGNSLPDHESSRENLIDPLFSGGVMGIYNGGLVANWGNAEISSSATDTLTLFLALTTHPVILVGHSQGGAVIAEALQALEGASRLNNVTVYTFGSPARNYPGNPDLHHHCTFAGDPVTIPAIAAGVPMNVIPWQVGHFLKDYTDHWDICSQ